MTTTLQSTVSAQLGWTWRDNVGTASIVDSNRLLAASNLADGNAANQCDAVWHAQGQSLAAGASATLLLDALEQPFFGDTITIALARVKAIQIVVAGESDGYLVVGAAAANAWYGPFGSATDVVKVMPDSPLLMACLRDGWTVDAANNALKIAAIGDAVTYNIAVLGTLAGA